MKKPQNIWIEHRPIVIETLAMCLMSQLLGHWAQNSGKMNLTSHNPGHWKQYDLQRVYRQRIQ